MNKYVFSHCLDNTASKITIKVLREKEIGCKK